MLDKFDAALRILSKIVLGLVVVIGGCMLVIAWAHVFWRYVLNNSLAWSEELLKILLVAFCMLSATVIAIRREHVSIVIFKQLFPKKVENILDIITQFIMFAASLVVCFIGFRMFRSAGIRRTPVLRIPYVVQYAPVCVSFAIMAVYELRNFLAKVLEPGRPAADTEKMGELVDTENMGNLL